MHNTTIPKIRCALCDKLVEKVILLEDVVCMETVIIVKCHGDEDRMRFAPSLMTEAQRMEIQYGKGVAFTTQRIESKAFRHD